MYVAPSPGLLSPKVFLIAVSICVKLMLSRVETSSFTVLSSKSLEHIKIPGIVLSKKGIYDEEKEEYSFKHNGYDYIVKNNSKLIVKCRDKVILSQESLH